MSKLKTNKGITLIALIITIVVLLILAVISIVELQDGKIIVHAENAANMYGKAEVEEKISLIFSEYMLSKYDESNINNKEIVNDILDIFNYPNIDEKTGIANDTTDGIITGTVYTMTSENGQVSIKDNMTSELLLQIFYDKNNNPEFKIIYNNKIYEYNKLHLASNTEYYIEGQIEDWQYTENEDGTLTLTKYLGTGEQDAENSDILNLTVPNKLKGKVVKTANIASTTQLNNINGTLTVSPGVTITQLKPSSIKKLILKENIRVEASIGSTVMTDLVLGDGCYINGKNFVSNSLKDVDVANNVTIDGTAFTGNVELTEDSVNNVLKAKLIGGAWRQTFLGCTFKEKINIIIPENSRISSSIFYNCTNIETITIKKGSNISVYEANTCFSFKNETIEKLIIEDECYIYRLIADINGSNEGLVINEMKLGNNISIKGRYDNYTIGGGIKICELTIGDNLITMDAYPIRNVTGLEKITIGDGLTITIDTDGDVGAMHWYSKFIENIIDLEEIEIGNNAVIEGKLGQNCAKLTKVTIGENSKLLNFEYGGVQHGAFSAFANIETVILKKGTEIGTNTFFNCRKLDTITLYLTEEQKEDDTKIPIEWQKNVPNAIFTAQKDDEKIVWSVTYSET